MVVLAPRMERCGLYAWPSVAIASDVGAEVGREGGACDAALIGIIPFAIEWRRARSGVVL